MITGATRVYAVLGRPIAHSASPQLHNTWFAEHGVDAVYVALEVKEGAEARIVSSLDALGICGANVTAPLKQAVVHQVSALDADAAAAGAVNTLVFEDKRWVGANTDVEGFARSVEQDQGSLHGDACIIGAGGAARAVAVALARRGASQVRILARDRGRAETLADVLAGHFPALPFQVAPIDSASLRGADLCVVATSGRPEAVSRLDPSVMRAGARWVDLNYWDRAPPAFASAQAAGLRAQDGRSMLVWQARLAFARFTGILPGE